MTPINNVRLRWVDKSSNPQVRTENVLQVLQPDGSWADVPHVGHIADLPKEKK